MFKLAWPRSASRASEHPLADPARAAQLIAELPVAAPAKALAEALACLESMHGEPFALEHRLQVLCLLDETVRPSVQQLTMSYLGVVSGIPGSTSDWRLLTEYLDGLASAYAELVDLCAASRNAASRSRFVLVVVRALRAVSLGMKVSCLRYLPPDRSSWEILVSAFRAARARGASQAVVRAYADDAESTSPLQELSVAALYTAAAPQNLTVRQAEVAFRVTSFMRARFDVQTSGDGEGNRTGDASGGYLLDLDQPGPPLRFKENHQSVSDALWFTGVSVQPVLQTLIDAYLRGARGDSDPFGNEFSASETLLVLRHLQRGWSASPPLRRDSRQQLDVAVQVEIGPAAIHAALEGPEAQQAPDNDLCMLDIAAADGQAQPRSAIAPLARWTVTDRSLRGIGARVSRRLDGCLRVGTLLSIRAEGSGGWAIGIVRRLRTDTRNCTDVGCELLTADALLVTLEGHGTPLGHSPALVRFTALMLPDNPEVGTRASLLFKPGTNCPDAVFTLMAPSAEPQRVRLRAASELLDGWERVEFERVG